MDWMISYDSLDDLQRKSINDIYESSNKISWIHGFAGSGKTIILLHIIKRFLIDHPNGTVCFVTYTRALKDLAFTGLSHEEICRIKVSTIFDFKNSSTTYDLILIDEVQDCCSEDIENANHRFKFKLVIAGDSNQQIYTGRTNNENLSEILGDVEQEELRIVHRLTDKIKKIATSILPSSNIVNAETPEQQSFLKRGADAYLYKADSANDEVKGILLNIKETPPKVGYPYAILFPTHDKIKQFIQIYQNLSDDIEINADVNNNSEFYTEFNSVSSLFQFLGNGIGAIEKSDQNSIVYLMTYHSSKGFDFEKVFIPFLNSDCLDPIVNREGGEIPDIDRKVLYVAVTRSKNDLIMSYNSDKPIKYIKDLVDNQLISASKMPTEPLISDDDDDDF